MLSRAGEEGRGLRFVLAWLLYVSALCVLVCAHLEQCGVEQGGWDVEGLGAGGQGSEDVFGFDWVTVLEVAV